MVLFLNMLYDMVANRNIIFKSFSYCEYAYNMIVEP